MKTYFENLMELSDNSWKESQRLLSDGKFSEAKLYFWASLGYRKKAMEMPESMKQRKMEY